MAKEIKQVGDIFKGVEKSYDIAFGAGILAVEEVARPMTEAVAYAANLPPKGRESKLGNAKHFLPKVTNIISTFLNTRCDMTRPNERSIDTNDDMECDTSIFHVWFCSDTAIDDDDINFIEKEEFPDDAIQKVNVSTRDRVNNTQPEPKPNQTLLKPFEINHLGFSNHDLDQLGATGGNSQSQVLLNHIQPGRAGGYYENQGPIGQVQKMQQMDSVKMGFVKVKCHQVKLGAVQQEGVPKPSNNQTKPNLT